MHVTLAKNLSYKNPVLICYKNLANGFINVSKLIWHWANEVAAAISAGLISVCRSSCQAASQWKGGFDILAVKGGFDILAVSWDEQKVCQLLPVTSRRCCRSPGSQPQPAQGKGTISPHIWSTPNREREPDGCISSQHLSAWEGKEGKLTSARTI